MLYTYEAINELYKIGCKNKLMLSGGNEGSEICQGKPADVVFVLDSSASINYVDFKRQLSFVQDVIDIFDMSPDMTRVCDC